MSDAVWPWVLGAAALGVTAWAVTRMHATTATASWCTVDEKRFHDWGAAEGYATVYLPNQSSPPPSIDDLSTTFTGLKQLAPLTKVVVALSDGSFWYYENLAATPVKRDDLRAQYCSTQKGTAAGHPADAFMVR